MLQASAPSHPYLRAPATRRHGNVAGPFAVPPPREGVPGGGSRTSPLRGSVTSRSGRAVTHDGHRQGGRGRPPDGDRAGLSVPAAVEYVAAIRLTAAGLGARCDLTLDEIEDLRLAVDEACGLVLAAAGDGDVLSVGFELSEGFVTVEVSVPREGEVDEQGLSWLVLRELSSSVAVVDGPDRTGIALSKRRNPARS